MAAMKKGDKMATPDTITLDNFIKDKVLLPRAGNLMEKDEMKFSLWHWLHSVINLLDDTINEAWRNGIIYGFASRDHCIQQLSGKPNGTFLLRFSESSLSGNYSGSKGALAAVVQNDGPPGFAPPINAEEIKKEGLARMIYDIGCEQLLGTRGIRKTIQDLLQEYPPSHRSSPQLNRYIGFTKKEVIVSDEQYYNVGSPSYAGQVMSPQPRVQPPEERKMKKGKRRTAKGSCEEKSKLHCINQPFSPESTTSSVPPSPSGIDQEFLPVGYTLQSQLGSGSTNIPTMVQGHFADQPPGSQSQVILLELMDQDGAMESEMGLSPELPCSSTYELMGPAQGSLMSSSADLVSTNVTNSSMMSALDTMPLNAAEESATSLMLENVDELMTMMNMNIMVTTPTETAPST